MKIIYLLRHAKSDWGDPNLKDLDRALNERGRAAAPLMGAYIKSKRYKPEVVLCSTARRTIETFDLIKAALGKDVNVQFEESLYLASVQHLMSRLGWIDDSFKSAMFIGHNPGMEQFANSLSASPKDADSEKLHRRMREKFSTCAFAVIKAPVKTWREVKSGGGVLTDFMRPKDL